jgi:hypothetical protein
VRVTHVVTVLAIAFAALAAIASVHPVSDPDVFWLARAGERIWMAHSVPTRNAWAFTDADVPWVLHEPLFALLFFGGISTMGPAFATLQGLFAGTITLLASLCVAFARIRAPARMAVAAFMLLLVAPTLFEPRPAFAAVLFAVLMTAVAFAPGWSIGRAAACVGLELVWTNAHGSFPLGVLVLAVASIEDRKRLPTAVAAGVVTLMNPYGLSLHRLVLRYLALGDETSRVFHAHVVEFFPLLRAYGTPYVHAGQLIAFALLVGATLHALLRGRRRGRALLVLLLVVMTLYQARHLTLAVVLGVLTLLTDDVGEEHPRVARVRRALALRLGLRSVLPGGILGLALFFAAFCSRGDAEWVGPALGGPELWHLAESLPPRARAYAPFQPSALLLWVGRVRGVTVFFDPRNDCYSAAVARMGFELEMPDVTDAAIMADLSHARTEYALVPEGGRVARALSSWRVAERDGAWVALAAP